MKVSVELSPDLLSRLYIVREHVHANSEISFLPVMPMDEFIACSVEAAVISYEKEMGLEVSNYDPS